MLIELSKYSLPPALGAVATLGLGLFVFLNNKRAEPNRVLAMMCLAIFIWLAAYAIAYSTGNDQLAILCARSACTSVAFVSLFFYHFAVAFLAFERERKYLRQGYLITWVFLIGFIFTDLLLNGTHRYYWGYYSKAGVLHPLYLLITYAMWFRSFYLLFASVRKESSPEIRNKIKYALAAFIIVAPCTVDYLPKYGFEFYPFGWTFVVLFVSVMAYVIVRHRVLDIEVVIKRTLQFAGLVGFAAFLMVVLPKYVLPLLGIPRGLAEWIGIVAVALRFDWMRGRLIDLTDRYLFQKKYDYKELLKKFSEEVLVVLDLKQLVQMTVQTLSEKMKLEGCSLLLLNKDTRKYELVAAKGTNGHPLVVFDEQEPFIALLKETYEPIRLDERSGKLRLPSSVSNRVKPLKAEWALPMEARDNLIGVLCLGKRKSDEEFSKDDFDFLQPFAHTLGIAMNNAQLVEEIKQKEVIEKQAVVMAMQSDKMATIGTLSAGINHEICNPLGIVKAQCEAFLLDAEDGILIGKSQQDVLERTSNIMRVALKQIDRATAITQKLSNFAKPVKEIRPEGVSVQEEIGEVLPLVGHDLTLQKIEITTEIAPNLPRIWVDRKQLQEVLFNLIRNAAQAITPPGTIWVRAHAEGEQQVRIEIADTGSGISPDKLEKIYDPFFTTKDPGKGTGLGLFIVRQIVERNRGRIAVESAVGKGTTFFLDFPAAARTLAAV